jgi:hypothetical protein
MKIKNMPLVVGISLPVIFIIIISVTFFVQSFYIKPQHNFIYTFSFDYYANGLGYTDRYKVKGDRIVLEPVVLQKNNIQENIPPPLYLYNIKTNSYQQITFEEAQSYAIYPGRFSPDGYEVAYHYDRDVFGGLFGLREDDGEYFVSNGSGKKKLSGLSLDKNLSYRNLKFIGWIK